MAYTKKFLKSRAACKVKFTVPPELVNDAVNIFLVGEFNDWSLDSHPMKKRKDGSFALEIELALGKDYQFRYLADGNRWFNDSESEAYVPCEFSGEENSVIKV